MSSNKYLKFITNKLKNDLHFNDLFKKSTNAFILKIIGAILAFVFNIIIARNLGEANTGIFFLVLSVCTIFAVIARLGFDNTLLKLVSAYSHQNDYLKLSTVVNYVTKYFILSGFIITIILFFNSQYISEFIFNKPEIIEPLKYLSFMIIPFGIVILYSQILKGLNEISLSISMQSILVPLLSILGVYFFLETKDVNSIILFYLVSLSISGLLITYITKKKIGKHKDKDKENINITSEIFSSSINLYIVSILNLIITWSPIIILGILSSNRDVGLLGVASRVIMVMGFLLLAVNSVTARKFSSYGTEKNKEALKQLLNSSYKLLFLVSLPVFLLTIIFSKQILSVFGHSFTDAVVLLQILAFGQFISNITGPVGLMLMMTGNEVLVRNNVISVSLLNIILLPLLTIKYGVIGAAISITIVMTTKNIISLIMARKYLNS